MNVDRARGIRRVLWGTLLLNLVVAVAKILYGQLNSALAIRADGFHSLTDATNNVVGLAGIYLASQPADKEHPYGHEKFELLASGLVGISLLAMAYNVLLSAIQRWGSANPELPHIDAVGFVVLGATLAVNILIAEFEKRAGERLDSPFLLSDALHTRSDVLVTVGVILTMALVQAGYPFLDIVSALAIAGFIAWAGIDVLRTNLKYLADAAVLDTSVIERIVLTVPGIASTHKIRTRGTPGAVHVDLHIQIARHLDVVQAHRVTHWVIEAIKRDIPGVTDVLVHTEPAAPDQPYNPLP
jgi:cation diffusion facilitator family transporter